MNATTSVRPSAPKGTGAHLSARLLSIVAFITLNIVAALFVLGYVVVAGIIALARSCIRIWRRPRIRRRFSA